MTTFDFAAFFTECRAEGASRDQMIISAYTSAGCTLNKAEVEYGRWAKAEGIVASVVSHKETALAYLTSTYDIAAWDVRAVRDAVAHIQSEFGVGESTARDYCKAFSEQLDVNHPVENPRQAIFDWVCEHIGHMGRDELRRGLIEFAVDELGRSRSNANEYVKGLDLHFAIMDNQS